MIKSNPRNSAEQATAVSNTELILCDGCQSAPALRTAAPVVNPPIAIQSLQSTLDEVYAPVLSVERENNFDDLCNRPLSEERPASRVLLTQSHTSAWLENTVHYQISSVPDLARDVAVRLFGDAGG